MRLRRCRIAVRDRNSLLVHDWHLLAGRGVCSLEESGLRLPAPLVGASEALISPSRLRRGLGEDKTATPVSHLSDPLMEGLLGTLRVHRLTDAAESVHVRGGADGYATVFGDPPDPVGLADHPLLQAVGDLLS